MKERVSQQSNIVDLTLQTCNSQPCDTDQASWLLAWHAPFDKPDDCGFWISCGSAKVTGLGQGRPTGTWKRETGPKSSKAHTPAAILP